MAQRAPRSMALLVQSLVITGCHGTLVRGITVRTEQVSDAAGGWAGVHQVTPTVGWRTTSPDHASMITWQPTLAVDGATSRERLFHRAEYVLEPAGRLGLHPFVRAAAEYGETRATDVLPAEDVPLEARPPGRVLRSGAVRAVGGLRAMLSPRRRLDAGVSVERSAGLDESRAAYPDVRQLGASVLMEERPSRRVLTRSSLNVVVRQDAQGRMAGLLEVVRTQRRQVSRALTVSLTTGALAVRQDGDSVTRGGATLGGVARTSFAFDAGRSTSVQLAATTEPVFDRLDGGLRRRVVGGVTLGQQVNPSVTLSVVAQRAADAIASGQDRQLLSVDAALRVGSGGGRSWEAGLRAFRQQDARSNSAARHTELRAYVGWSMSAITRQAR